jgi:hypothetical protein
MYWLGSGDDDNGTDRGHWGRINVVLAGYGGYADECSRVEPDHVPFAGLFQCA